MKKFALIAAGLTMGFGTLSATAASAQSWQPINQRQANLERRIDQGARTGQLSRREAANLRAQFRQLERLEYRYRAGGLSRWERADLNRRFDVLSAKVRWDRHDGNHRPGRRG